MAGSVNKVIIIGNLGKDPEVRRFGNDGMSVTISVATSETWKDKNTGERREKTEWHRVVIENRKICDVAERYLRKGAKVYLEGKLQTREWDDHGTKKYITEIIVPNFRGKLEMLTSPRDEQGGQRPALHDSQRGGYGPEDDGGEIPF